MSQLSPAIGVRYFCHGVPVQVTGMAHNVQWTHVKTAETGPPEDYIYQTILEDIHETEASVQLRRENGTLKQNAMCLAHYPYLVLGMSWGRSTAAGLKSKL